MLIAFYTQEVPRYFSQVLWLYFDWILKTRQDSLALLDNIIPKIEFMKLSLIC